MPTTAVLPYLASPGSLTTIFDRIKRAATPDRITGEVVENSFQMKGGAGRAILPYLKRINFVGSDGVPTELYRKFRNDVTSGRAVADAVLHGYAPLKALNERFYEANDADLKALIIQVTGAASDSSAVTQTLGTLKKLVSYADFRGAPAEDQTARQSPPALPPADTPQPPPAPRENAQSLGLNLAYTINLNLPATSDQAVFNAIFRSLKEHLLSARDE
jgi:hypothetical protein